MAKQTKRKLDLNENAKRILDLVTGDRTEDKTEDEEAIKAAAAALGRKGGLKGGPARKAALSAKRRSDIARKAARARWGK